MQWIMQWTDEACEQVLDALADAGVDPGYTCAVVWPEETGAANPALTVDDSLRGTVRAEIVSRALTGLQAAGYTLADPDALAKRYGQSDIIPIPVTT